MKVVIMLWVVSLGRCASSTYVELGKYAVLSRFKCLGSTVDFIVIAYFINHKIKQASYEACYLLGYSVSYVVFICLSLCWVD